MTSWWPPELRALLRLDHEVVPRRVEKVELGEVEHDPARYRALGVTELASERRC